ncbi:GTP 3',8-cyclase MoaA [Allohahella marinimesophila]
MSVTDRCDFRCVYCMSEDMTFLPKASVLTLEELAHIGSTFVELGVQKIRLTGGEPLVRRDVMSLVTELGRLEGLKELTMTTNGSQLVKLAQPLRAAGLSRLNVSLDSLIPERFRELTRTGDLQQVLSGIDAAKAAGFPSIKLNAVIMKGRNEDEVLDLVRFVLSKGLDLSFIEEMPLGAITEHDRASVYVSSEALRQLITSEYQLQPMLQQTALGGPSRYWRIPGHESRIGFISPHSENFCATCNRVRLTVEGRLLLCLGNEHSIDLREIVRQYPNDRAALKAAIVASMDVKPERHHFDLDDEPQIVRFMNMTGG